MGFFNQPKPKRFELKPRYWDPEAEARKEREKRMRAELGLKEDGEEYIPDVRSGFQREYARRKANRPAKSMSYSLRLFLILIVILLVIFYLATYKLDLILKLF
ncbi:MULTISPECIES: hypothetical protein [Gabonibacter]|uniref:hypothetical protein n=1 Tax=Gabonibacter TaxID=1911312 RepID=UPI00073F8504|nr:MULTISPECIES: hypothetical protein [Gabonibacter]MCR9011396.1 hypothetical protein [Gabonibacter chumensis]